MDTPQAGYAPSAQTDSGLTAERRAESRTSVTQVSCDLGRVLDLSTRGMRLIAKRRWPQGRTRKVTLSDGAHEVTVEARCIWDRHEGIFRHTIGLAFEGLRPEHEGMLLRLATEHGG